MCMSYAVERSEVKIHELQKKPNIILDREQLPDIAKNIYFKEIKSSIDLKNYIKPYKYQIFSNLDDLVSSLYKQIESFTKTT
jgi:hypothetical protein